MAACRSSLKELQAVPEKKHASVRISGVDGSGEDKCPHIAKGVYGWLRLWAKVCQSSTTPTCCAIGCLESACIGGHMWLWGDNGRASKQHCYIAPVCKAHNSKKYDWPTPGFKAKPGTWLMQMLPHVCFKQVEYDVILII